MNDIQVLPPSGEPQELGTTRISAVSTVMLMRAMVSSLSRLPLPMTSVSATRFSSVASSMAALSSLRNLSVTACLSTSSGIATETQHQQSDSRLSSELISDNGSQRWRPMCLYHTQGRCTMLDDPSHIEKFNHNVAKDLQVNVADLGRACDQDVDYFLVLDLEGKVEILEFPVLIVDARTLDIVDSFHRFVRPTKMSEQRINEYIEGKYGKFGVDRVWHDTAIPFKDTIDQFEGWLTEHQLWVKEGDGGLNRAAFVTCGNWDLKSKVPQQCKVSGIKLPPYFMEWINLKDVYLNFYNREARGMMSMMKQLGIPSFGSHHLGIDDTKNIARVLQRMVVNGAHIKITARRNPKSPDSVHFLFENRIR